MDRITQLRVRELRAVREAAVNITRPLTVLIGENGSGKSTLVEAAELLRQLPDSLFLERFFRIHGGFPALLRRGATELGLGVTVEDDAGVEPPLHFDVALVRLPGGHAAFSGERFAIGPTPEWNEVNSHRFTSADDLRRLAVHLRTLSTQSEREEATFEVGGRPYVIAAADWPHLEERASAVEAEAEVEETRQRGRPFVVVQQQDRSKATVTGSWQHRGRTVAPLGSTPLSFTIDEAGPHGQRLAAALRNIEVHLGFDGLASWAARTAQRPEPIRGPSTLYPASRLQLLGANLASAWAALRNRDRAHWDHTLELVRLGLGDRVDSVVTEADPGGGNVWLAVRFRDLGEPPLPAACLSDGQLAWLAFVALARSNATRSLLVVDEPDLHLHPALLQRVVELLADLDGGSPTLLTTHSDRVLELVDDPAALRVSSLEEGVATVRALDPVVAEAWLREFANDLGRLRQSGWLPRALGTTS